MTCFILIFFFSFNFFLNIFENVLNNIVVISTTLRCVCKYTNQPCLEQRAKTKRS